MNNYEVIPFEHLKKKQSFNLMKPLWYGRSFLAWVNFLVAEGFIILSITSLGHWISIVWGFFAGFNLSLWYQDRMFNIMQGLIKELLEFVDKTIIRTLGEN